jgi:Family of unknown function (DUF5681)
MSSDPIPPGNSPPSTKTGSGRRKPGKRRGRPKGSRNAKTIVQAIAREKHTVREGDETIQLTTVELVLRLFLAEAMKGNIQAEKRLDRLQERQRPPAGSRALLIVTEALSIDEIERRTKIRNSLRKNPMDDD